jgi:hypothetical protein
LRKTNGLSGFLHCGPGPLKSRSIKVGSREIKLIEGNQVNGHGGRRENAGRKVGSIAKKTRAVAEAAAAAGLTPLEYALQIMRDERQPVERRDAMCELAMPFMHPKLVLKIAPDENFADGSTTNNYVQTINVVAIPTGCDVNGKPMRLLNDADVEKVVAEIDSPPADILD